MPSFNDSAIVLARLDYSETSQILALFTRTRGHVRAIAKGIKRSTKTRFAVPIDLLEIGIATLAAKHERPDQLATLTEWKQTQGLTALREKLARIHAAQYAAEITSLLTVDWDPHPHLFDALSATLESISESDQSVAAVVRYQIILLNEIGSLPRFNECVSCGQSEKLTYFSSFEGGMLCERCAERFNEKRTTSTETLTLLQNPGALNSPRPFALLNYHISHLAGRQPKTASELLKQVRS